jgi:hypothetical protein
MKTVTCFVRLASMRRAAGAGPVEAMAWAGGLLWRARRASFL